MGSLLYIPGGEKIEAIHPYAEIGDSRKVIYLIVVLTIMQLAISLLTYGQALYFDEATWHYIGRNWFRHGMVPYTGGYDNKSPLIFVLYGISDMLFGVNYWFPRVLGTLVQSTGIYFLYRSAVYLAGRRAGTIAVILYGLSAMWADTKGKYVSLTETYEVSALIIAVYLWLTARGRGGLLTSGLFAALALAFRLTAVAGVLSIFIFSFLKRRADGGWFTLGVLAGSALTAGAIRLAGISLSEVWHYSFIDNLTSGSLFDRSPEEKISGLMNGFVASRLAIFYPLVIGYLIVRRSPDWIICWWLAGCYCIFRIGLFDPAHFKDILPALSLVGGFFVEWIITRYRFSFGVALAVIALCFFPGLTEPLGTVRELLGSSGMDGSGSVCRPPYSPLDNISRKRLGCWIRDHSLQTDRLLIPFFDPVVQVYSERVSPTIYFSLNENPNAMERFRREVRARRPELVVIPLGEDYRTLVGAEMRSWVQKMVDTAYRDDTCVYGYTIYRKVK
jgi:hypothetical protein